MSDLHGAPRCANLLSETESLKNRSAIEVNRVGGHLGRGQTSGSYSDGRGGESYQRPLPEHGGDILLGRALAAGL